MQLFEWSELNNQVNRLIIAVEQLAHITAVKGTRDWKKKFKAPKLGWPTTAVDALKKRARRQHELATKAFMSMFEFVPEAEFLAEVAEHEAAVEAGLPSPVEERAAEQARAAARKADAEWLSASTDGPYA